ncbi:MAG: hypothetical protein ACTSU2_04040 [Promethearchaeota archaeon]
MAINKNKDLEEKRGKEDKTRKVQCHTRVSKECYDKITELSQNERSKGDLIEKAIKFYAAYKQNWDKYQKIWNKARELNMVLVGKTTFLSYLTGDYKQAWKKNVATEIIEWYSKKAISDMSLDEVLEYIKDIWIAANYFNKVIIEDNPVYTTEPSKEKKKAALSEGKSKSNSNSNSASKGKNNIENLENSKREDNPVQVANKETSNNGREDQKATNNRIRNIYAYHSFNKVFSEFWANYFKYWFEGTLNIPTDYECRNESFILKLKLKRK